MALRNGIAGLLMALTILFAARVEAVQDVYDWGYAMEWNTMTLVYWSYRYTDYGNGHGMEMSCYAYNCTVNDW